MANDNISKENTISGKLLYILIKYIIAPIFKLIWIKKIEGFNNIPKRGPYIVVANHQSYLDFISLVCIWPERLTFLAAEKFYNSKFWRPIMEYTGQIKIDREASDKTEAIEKGMEVLKNGKVLALFPQGTRSRSGEIEKVYTGVAKFSLGAQVPVIPVGIIGAFEIMPPHSKFPKLKKQIELIIGEPMNFQEYYQREKNQDLYNEVTDKIIAKVAGLSGKQLKIN